MTDIKSSLSYMVNLKTKGKGKVRGMQQLKLKSGGGGQRAHIIYYVRHTIPHWQSELHILLKNKF